MPVSNIIIAESLDIYREGLRAIIERDSCFSVVGDVSSAKSLIRCYSQNPDCICLIASTVSDMNIHDIMQKLNHIHNEAAAIVLTHSTDPSHLDMALKAGVRGYLTKQSSSDELIKIIREVSSGKNSYSASVTELMIGKYRESTKRTNPIAKKLTKREREILKFIVKGYTSPEIAKVLYISPRTVETHRSNLMNKLKLKNTAALVRYAIQEGKLS